MCKDTLLSVYQLPSKCCFNITDVTATQKLLKRIKKKGQYWASAPAEVNISKVSGWISLVCVTILETVARMGTKLIISKEGVEGGWGTSPFTQAQQLRKKL